MKLVKKITKNVKQHIIPEEDNPEVNKTNGDNIVINGNINNGNINNGTINNNTQNIIIVNNFGKEDISHIKDQGYKVIINRRYDGLLKLIETVHFNDNKPENFNVYLSSIRNEFANIYENNSWKLKDVDDVIEQLKDDKIAILDKKTEELNDTKLKDTYNTFKGRLYSNAVADKNLSKNIKLAMYNNSEKVIKNRKKNKK